MMLFGEPMEAAKALVTRCPAGHILLRPQQAQTSQTTTPGGPTGISVKQVSCYNPQDNPDAGLHFELHEADKDMLPKRYNCTPIYQFWPILDLESDLQSENHSHEDTAPMTDVVKPMSAAGEINTNLSSANNKMNRVLEHMCYARSDFHTLALQWKRLRPNDASAAKDTVTFVRLAHAVKQVCCS